MDVAIVKCTQYEYDTCLAALRDVLEPLDALDWVRPGMRVAVKANLVSMLRPDAAATTHPVLLSALAELLRERGATAVIGDSPGGLYNAAYLAGVYRVTGVGAAQKHGAELNQDFSQAKAENPDAAVMKSFQYTAWLDKCDGIIDFCKLKSHGMMSMSAATKNLFGTIPGTLKPEYHFRYPDHTDFARMLVDLAEYWKPRLCIVDAVVGMEGNGPTAGTPKPIGCLIAGASTHKVDLVCAKILGLERSSVPTLQAALERGLIPERTEELAISGDPDAFVVPDFENIKTRSGVLFQNDIKGPLGKYFTPFLLHTIASRPKVEKRSCIGCRKCAEICPAKAIVMRNGRPRIDRKLCIRCFCCQEFCPKGAMKVSRPPLAKLLNK